MLRGQRTTVHTKSARAHPTVAGPAQNALTLSVPCALKSNGAGGVRSSPVRQSKIYTRLSGAAR